MPILWDFGGPDSNSQATHRPGVARPMQPVEQPVRTGGAQQFSHRILWHGVRNTTAATVPSTNIGGETLGEGAR